VPPGTDSSAEPAGQAAANDYDRFAEAYSAANEASLLNAYYERPATLALAGDVAGRRILDAGCGSGPLFAALRDRGAIVTGFDKSTGMLELARRRLGDGADLRVADLGRPLPFAKTCWQTTATTASFAEAVRENEEVVPVNVSTWVLPSGVTVGR
jgi:ubiquinone/menaquinone biosynthesis C-methylase UbiE